MRVGDHWRSRGRTITEADVVGFAGLSGDFHPVHTDATYAAETPFGQRLAHGMLILSYTFGLVPSEFAVAVRRIRQVTFKNPVFLGDTITAETTIKELREVSEEVGLVTGQWRVTKQDGTLAMKLEVDALWQRNWPSRERP
jgi:acyl dehydratase